MTGDMLLNLGGTWRQTACLPSRQGHWVLSINGMIYVRGNAGDSHIGKKRVQPGGAMQTCCHIFVVWNIHMVERRLGVETKDRYM